MLKTVLFKHLLIILLLIAGTNIHVHAQAGFTTIADTVILLGLVLDEKNEPVIDAAISLDTNKTIIYSASTDVDGYFYARLPNSLFKQNQVNIKAKYSGYFTTDTTITDPQPVITIKLNPDPAKLHERPIIHYYFICKPIIDTAQPNTKTINGRDLHNMGY